MSKSEYSLDDWEYVFKKFVAPIFDGTSHANYLHFLAASAPQFSPDLEVARDTYNKIQGLKEFDQDVLKFFSFLNSIGFFRALSFEEWLNADYWRTPWNEMGSPDGKSVRDVLAETDGVAHLKSELAELTIFQLK